MTIEKKSRWSFFLDNHVGLDYNELIKNEVGNQSNPFILKRDVSSKKFLTLGQT